MKRNLFAELKEGMDALAAEREGKVTLREAKARAPEPLDENDDPESSQMPEAL